MGIIVRLYGEAQRIAGARDVEVDVEAGATVEDVVLALFAAYPALVRSTESAALFVNREPAAAGMRVRTGDRLVLLPAVVGGTGSAPFAQEALSLAAHRVARIL